MVIESTGVVKFPNTATSTGDVGTIAHYTNNYMYIRGGTSGLAIGDDGFGVSVYLNNSDSMQFNTGGTQRMRITSTGVVEIGSSTAQTNAKLNVRNNGSVIEFGHTNNGGRYFGTVGSYGSNGQPFISFGTYCEQSANTFTTIDGKGNIITNDAFGNLIFQQVTSAAATGQTPVERMRITDLGRVVIGSGTASANTLTLVGSAVELDIHNTSGKRWRFNADTSGNLKFEDKTGGTEAMRIASNGNVGIANTNPQAALDISSNYSIQGGVRTYAYQGIAGGTTNINLDITVGNEGGQGNVFKIEAGFAHYYAMSYNSVAEWWCTSRGTAVINTYILNAGTTLGGDWSASKPNLTTLRITKSSGTYGGTGKYWVKVTYVPF
tara:strand:- start:45 stop:1181 length:1137 start_codon:yes stop_codon:yes gene_type:complete